MPIPAKRLLPSRQIEPFLEQTFIRATRTARQPFNELQQLSFINRAKAYYGAFDFNVSCRYALMDFNLPVSEIIEVLSHNEVFRPFEKDVHLLAMAQPIPVEPINQLQFNNTIEPVYHAYKREGYGHLTALTMAASDLDLHIPDELSEEASTEPLPKKAITIDQCRAVDQLSNDILFDSHLRGLIFKFCPQP